MEQLVGRIRDELDTVYHSAVGPEHLDLLHKMVDELVKQRDEWRDKYFKVADESLLRSFEDAAISVERHKAKLEAYREMFDSIAYSCANHWHSNPEIDKQCKQEAEYAVEVAEDALEALAPEVLDEIERLREEKRK